MTPESVSSEASSLTTASGLPHENNITAVAAVMLHHINILWMILNYFFALMVVVSPIQPPIEYD